MQNLITINHSQEGNQKTHYMQISQVGEAIDHNETTCQLSKKPNLKST
jgi:hypothetical protein